MSRPIKVKWKETEQQLLSMYRTERDARFKMRLQALWRICSGDSMINVANTLGISDRAVRNWLRWYRQGGIEQLRQRRQGGHGRQPKLSEEQLEQLRQVLSQGIVHTNEQIRTWLEQRLHIEYSESGLYKLLQRLHLRKRATRPARMKTEALSAQKRARQSRRILPVGL